MSIGLGEVVDEPTAMAFLSRFVIDTASGIVTCEQLDDRGGDFPRINERFAGTQYRYGYLACFGAGQAHRGHFDSIVKYDVQAGTSRAREWGEGFVVGEPVFAPDPSGPNEDDGWVLTFVYDLARDASDVVILDGHSLDQVASIHIPRRVPFGFHGNWLPNEG